MDRRLLPDRARCRQRRPRRQGHRHAFRGRPLLPAEGTKQFITNGSFADMLHHFRQDRPGALHGVSRGKDYRGAEVGPEEKKLGIKGSSTTQVILDNARVPVENVLGQIGKGHKIAFNVLNIGRFKLGAGVTGAGKHALAEGIRYANMRKQFGAAISTFGAIKEKIADMTAALFAAESLVYRLAGLHGQPVGDDTLSKSTRLDITRCTRGIEEYAIECAIAKVFCSEVLPT